MDRRTFVSAVAGSLLGAPTAAFPQQQGTVHRIGFLGAEGASHDQGRLDALRESLRDLGYIEGKNLIIEVRLAEGKYDRLTALASELVARKVDVIVTDGVKATVGAKRATATTPIVASNMGDAVNAGLVASYAKPGGNVTGTSYFSPEVMVKRLEFLKEADPRITKVGVLVNPDNPNFDLYVHVRRDRAVSLRVNIEPITVSGASALEPAFLTMAQRNVDAVIVHNDTMFLANAKATVDLIEKHRIASAGWAAFGNAGGLIGYGASSVESWRYIAAFVDKILKGARPADLPVQQPTKFLLVINLKTAKALSLTVPQSLFLRADEVIQ